FFVSVVAVSEKLLEKTCTDRNCYEVTETETNDGVDNIIIRQLYLIDRSRRYLLSSETLRPPTLQFEKNDVTDTANRDIIGALFASQTVPKKPKKAFNVLYSTNAPGEIDRYFAQNDQFNASVLISDLSALEISRRWMGIENNGVNYVPDPSGQYLEALQENGAYFDAYVIDRCEFSKGARICHSKSIIDWDRLHFFSALLKPNGVLIIRLTSGESAAQMAHMAMDELFPTCYKCPEEVRRRGEMQLLICTLLPTATPWEHLRRSIKWKEDALNLPNFHD
ncbi:hypothetical protein PMAYCL1PPCAC_32694, partial [Pristionchus mayeri]